MLLCSLPWAVQPAVLPDSDYAALTKAVIDQAVVPAYVEHARAMRQLGPAIERYCMGDSAADVAAVRAAFGESMDAWQRAWPFGVGPVMRGAGRARIAFWPGRPGSAARQMRKALRTRDESLLDPGQLAGKSVAVKDLQALERLLFDVPRDAYTCGFAGAIARYQSNLAEEIVHEWTKEGGFRQAMIAAGAASDEYADDAEAARDVMRVLSESLDAVIAQKLEAPLGESAAKAKPKRAESWRSERSMRNIVLNISTGISISIGIPASSSPCSMRVPDGIVSPSSHSSGVRSSYLSTRRPMSAEGCASTRVRCRSTPPEATSRSPIRMKAS